MESKENEKAKKLSDEEIKHLVMNAFSSSQTIEEAIAQKREQDRNMKVGFIVTKLA